MKRIMVLAMLALSGCANLNGPFTARQPQRVDDPRLSIPEQQARGRDRLALPQAGITVPPQPRSMAATFGEGYP